MEMGAGCPEQFVPIRRMQNVGLSCQEKSLASASGQTILKFVGAAANTRRLFGSCVGAASEDVLFTGDVDRPLGGDGDQEARATYQKAGKQAAGRKRRREGSKG